MRLTHTPLAHGPLRLLPHDSSHAAELRAAAADPDLWTWWPRAGLDRAFDDGFAWLSGEVAAGRMMAFTVMLEGRAIGQTCYLNIRPEHAGVEIGHTWYARAAHGGIVNPTAKLLMLGHAFGCGAERVELKTDSANACSRAAIEKLGARFEGVFRRHMRRPDGTWRDTAWYAILADEWPHVRSGLLARIENAAPAR